MKIVAKTSRINRLFRLSDERMIFCHLLYTHHCCDQLVMTNSKINRVLQKQDGCRRAHNMNVVVCKPLCLDDVSGNR